MYNHSLSEGANNLNKLTFGININLKNQISFLEALKSCKKYLDNKISDKSQLNKKLNHCLGAYTSIYLIRSCLKIKSIKSFLNFYFFWKKILKKKIFHALRDYSPKSWGNIILNLFIKNEFYLISVIIAFLISKKDTCKMKHQKFNLNQIEKKLIIQKKDCQTKFLFCWKAHTLY